MNLALYLSRVRSNEVLGRAPLERLLVDARPTPDLAFHHFDLAPARIIVLLAQALGPIALFEVIVCLGIYEALTFALCAVRAALAAI
jgi:hypothetical protein